LSIVAKPAGFRSAGIQLYSGLKHEERAGRSRSGLTAALNCCIKRKIRTDPDRERA